MKTKINTLLGAALSLLVTFGGTRMRNAVRALVAMASLGAALSTTPALAQVWQASTDYGTVQGYRNWRYMSFRTSGSTYQPMVYGIGPYGAVSWYGVDEFGDFDGSDIHASSMHPTGPGGGAARVWESPIAGTVRVTGTVAAGDNQTRDPNFPSDGVRATIWKNGELLFIVDIEDADLVGYSYDISVDVMPGDWLVFRVEPHSTNYYDRTSFDPRITVTSLAGSSGASWIESVLRDESSYVQGLDLNLFEGPTTSAMAGRRLALSHGLTVAANLVATGNITAAMSELWGISVRLDGDPSPADWMLDGPERQALCADIQQLIYLLGLP